MKLSELIDQNYRLLPVLARMGVRGSFGEKTVSEVCSEVGLDPETTILICKVYSGGNFKLSRREIARCRPADVLNYIHQSHSYYQANAIEEIEKSVRLLIEPCSKGSKKVVWEFFMGYKDELRRHFKFEEEKLIPYVQSLIDGSRKEDFTIEFFEKNHTNVDEKLGDLKNIVMKFLPHECDEWLRLVLLQQLFALEEDLHSHTCIEDNILVPMVKYLENSHAEPEVEIEENTDEEDSDALSEREKEILVCVAKGLINKEIADELNISVNTVITHRRNITHKIGIRSIPGLTVYAILNNLVDINEIA